MRSQQAEPALQPVPRRSLGTRLQRKRTEVFGVACLELVPGVGMALAAEVLQGVGGGDGADLRRHLDARAVGEALHQAAAKRVAHTGRIDDAMGLYRFDVAAPFRRVNRAAVLAARD